MVDRYTKIVLTVIAAALVANVVTDLTSVDAQVGGLGGAQPVVLVSQQGIPLSTWSKPASGGYAPVLETVPAR